MLCVKEGENGCAGIYLLHFSRAFQPLPSVGSGDVIGEKFPYYNENDTIIHRDTFLTTSTLFNSAGIFLDPRIVLFLLLLKFI
jgi:hypothetical protein